MVDVIVAIGVFAVVMALVSGMLAAGMRGVLLGKRREVAAQEANRLLEVARALSFDEIGLAPPGQDPTIAADPAIVDPDVDGVLEYLVDGQNGVYEPIIWATNTTNHPFNPHERSVSRGSTDLTTFVYVTGMDTDGDGALDMKRILARVAWSENGTAGPANELLVQTLVDENGLVPVGQPGAGGIGPDGGVGGGGGCPASGCITGTPPMAAEALAAGGTMSIRSDRGVLSTLEDASLVGLDPVIATMPTTSGNTTLRAVSVTNCTAESAFLQGANTYGRHGIAVTADDDGSTATPSQPPSKSWSGSPPDPVSGGGPVDALVVESAISSPISCAASAKDADGQPPTDDGLPFERGTGSGPGTLTMNEDLTGANLTSNVLTVLAVQTPSVQQQIDHSAASGTREITASASGAFGTVQVLKTAGVLPSGLVQVDAFEYGARTTASAGTPSSGPSVTSPTGVTFSVFDPAKRVPSGVCTSRSGSYCVVSFDPSAAGFDGVSVSYNDSITANLGLTKLSFQVDVRAFPPSVGPAGGTIGPNGESRWAAGYTALSISARLTVEVVVDPLLGTDVVLTDTAADLKLGMVTAGGCRGVTCA